MTPIKSFRLDVAGLGMIFYSPFSASMIQEGEDYLEAHFFDPDLVEKQAVSGGIVGVSTGTPGSFLLDVFKGYPEADILDAYQYKLRLGVEVRDGALCVRDLYDLMSWEAQCPEQQSIALDDGFYHVTLLTNEPASGVLGDDQVIAVYLQALSEMPQLRYNGVPTLC